LLVDGGKAGLFLCSILEEIGLEQIEPTKILYDNQGALKITNAQQPSKCTHHIEIKEFTIQHWVASPHTIQVTHLVRQQVGSNSGNILMYSWAAPSHSTRLTLSNIFGQELRQPQPSISSLDSLYQH
jgi:hypothetical protein